MRRNGWLRRHAWLFFVFAFALAAAPAYGFDTHFQACFNPSGGWGVASPVIDGTFSNESGWARTFQYRFQNGASPNDADVRMLLTSAGNKLYVAFEVNGDQSYDALDMVVLAFKTGSTCHRVIVHPFPDTSSPTGPPLTTYYDQAACPGGSLVNYPGSPHAVTPTDPVETDNDNTTDNKFRVWTTASGIPSGGVGSWTTEIAIPLGTGTDRLPLPSGTDIGMYVAVSRTMNPTHITNPPANYYSWPISLWSNTSSLDLDHNLPNPDNWGVARIGSNSTCNGLSVTDVRTLDPENMANGFLLARNQNNGFRLTVQNTSVKFMAGSGSGSGSSVPVDVTGVGARFSVGQWGMPLSWKNVASAPTTTTVGSNATVTIDSGFTYNPTTAGDLVFDHVCLLGEVETTQGDSSIVQKSVIINTQWGPASTAIMKPFLQTSRLKPEAGSTTNRLLIHSKVNLQFALSGGEIPEQGVGALTAQATFRFDAYHVGGRTLVVNGVRQPVETPKGTFVEIIRHQLPLAFAQEFAKRHAAQQERAQAIAQKTMGERQDKDALQRAQALAFNDMLASDNEKPAATDFALQIQGASKVRERDNVYQLDIPPGQDVTLTTAASYVASGSGGPPIKTCGTCNFGNSSEAAASGLIVVAVALLVRRRRARR